MDYEIVDWYCLCGYLNHTIFVPDTRLVTYHVKCAKCSLETQFIFGGE